ncbi:hypothetical protein [Conexibacter sp. CPCC 206217]|uniref:hypothetical protein n=1 Tax=Conexibacter sp. CPCC 206217 TaxID=3064574 RepID=UPI00271905D1|nr:hypothetical protein [Conexibacter sp. CPCC 206217]MDO8208985.1 hypothetical protein [Conexibacter sp. CPCC 206217]
MLAVDANPGSGGLAFHVGCRSKYSLADLARVVERDEQLQEAPFAIAGERLRVLAAEPRPDATRAVDGELVERVLDDARRAHALTVVDCGTPASEFVRVVLRVADRVLWVVPGTVSAIARGRALLRVHDESPPSGEGIVARHDGTGQPAPLHALAEMAESRGAPLVLVPHIADVDDLPLLDRVEQAAVPLAAIGRVIRR